MKRLGQHNESVQCSKRMYGVEKIHHGGDIDSGKGENTSDLYGDDCQLSLRHNGQEVIDGRSSRDEIDNSPQDIIDLDPDEPNWNSITQTEPAKSDAPIFLMARDKRNAEEVRFAAALDEAHESLKLCFDEILHIIANKINSKQEGLDEMETQIKQQFEDNEIARSTMSKRLEEFATQAQKQFQALMSRLSRS